MAVRSMGAMTPVPGMVDLIQLFAVETLEPEIVESPPKFRCRLARIFLRAPDGRRPVCGG